MRYSATLHHNLRDSETLSPKALLTGIIDEKGRPFRDHAWVTLTVGLQKVMPKTNRYKTSISFTAKTKKYQTREEEKTTLTKITDIKKV